MPIKAYKCDSCGHKFDKLFFTGDEEKNLSCPSCNSSRLTRSFWEQTVAISSSSENECCMNPMGANCPSRAPGGG